MRVTKSIQVTIRVSSDAYHRALDMINENDPDMCRRYGIDEDMTVEEYLALLLERKLR